MQITIELTKEEAKFLSSFCILRAIKSAADAVPDDYDYLDELLEAGEIYENLRNKMVNQLFGHKLI